MSIRSYHDYHKEEKTHHQHGYSSLTLTLTLKLQKGVHIAQEFHLRGAQTNSSKAKVKIYWQSSKYGIDYCLAFI